MRRHIERTHAQLADLAALAEKTERAERRILEQAEKRLDAVNAELERRRPGVEAASDDDQQHYTDLVAERGHLHQVIAKAHAALS